MNRSPGMPPLSVKLYEAEAHILLGAVVRQPESGVRPLSRGQAGEALPSELPVGFSSDRLG